MKKILYFGIFILLVFNVNIYGKEGKNHLALRADTLKTDSVEYELVVFDPGFETWLLNQHPMNYYSKEYYETKNLFYVNVTTIHFNMGTFTKQRLITLPMLIMDWN